MASIILVVISNRRSVGGGKFVDDSEQVDDDCGAIRERDNCLERVAEASSSRDDLICDIHAKNDADAMLDLARNTIELCGRALHGPENRLQRGKLISFVEMASIECSSRTVMGLEGIFNGFGLLVDA